MELEEIIRSVKVRRKIFKFSSQMDLQQYSCFWTGALWMVKGNDLSSRVLNQA